MESGLTKFDEISSNLKDNEINGKDAFLLYDTYGFPLDLTELIAKERNYNVDRVGFEAEMIIQKERSRQSAKKTNEIAEDVNYNVKSEFLGYEKLECKSVVKFQDKNIVILDKTPFYAEKGGQISDTGVIKYENFELNVIDVKQIGDAILHILDDECSIDIVGKEVFISVDFERRWDIMRNHSATHLMHEALRRVLGGHIQQQGSLVSDSYLRFDFNHFNKISNGEITEIESIVNKKILEAIEVKTDEISIEDARKNEKIRMFFGDKYGSVVRAVTMDSTFSIELCGGTHVRNTSQISFFKIISEVSVSAGVRRIEAITGRYLNNYIEDLYNQVLERDSSNSVLKDKIKQLEKELSELKKDNASSDFDNLLSKSKLVNNINVIAFKLYSLCF